MKFVVVMPFDSAFDPIYAAIKSSVETAVSGDDCVCIRVDEDLKAGHITPKILEHLRSADICIADVTHYKPNVMWEVGFIEALQKPLIALSQSTLNVPFNIQDLNILPYASADLEKTLSQPLIRSIQQTLAGLGAQRTKLTVAITGSRNADRSRVQHVIQRYTTPFLSPETTWYCGTNSPVAEEAATFLLKAGQRVYGVYSNTHHVSPKVQAVFTEHNASLLNADSVPSTYNSPGLSQRDAYLAAESDFFILVWDKGSRHTGDLHQWVIEHRKDHLLTFV